MTRMKWFGCAAILFTLLGTYPLVAQTATSPVSRRGTTPTHKQPCWQQAGVSQSAMQQRRQIEETRTARLRPCAAILPLRHSRSNRKSSNSTKRRRSRQEV
jgi:hypothetical protein